MLSLGNALQAWGTPDFEAAIKQELAQQAGQLPLQQGLASGNYVTEAPPTIAINSVAELEETIRIKTGIFYESMMSGCGCADDPTPIGENAEYCEVQLDIDKTTGAATVTLL